MDSVGRARSGIEGRGNLYDYGFRIYDQRIARFLSVDPLTDDFPWYTPNQYAGDTPTRFIDLSGAEPAKSPSAIDRGLNFLSGQNHVTRTLDFAAEHRIDVGNIFYYPVAYEHGSTIIIFHPVYTPTLSKTTIYKHVFRESKRDEWNLATSEGNDDRYLKWDLKFDADGVPIPNSSDLKE